MDPAFSLERGEFENSELQKTFQKDLVAYQEGAFTPTISVDRAIGHLVEGFSVDVDAIRDFYYSLPHANKLNLENLRIHFSAARPVNDSTETVGAGTCIRNGTTTSDRKDRSITPELEETDQPTIIIYVGAAAIENDDGKGPKFTDEREYPGVIEFMLNRSLAHELTHYAQIDEADLVRDRTKEITNKAKLKLAMALVGAIRNKGDIVIGATAAGIAEIATDGGYGSIATGLGVSAVSHLSHRKERLRKQSDRQHERYRDADYEVDARKHEEDHNDIVRFIPVRKVELPKGKDVTSFVKPSDRRMDRVVANSQHKELSLTPRKENYREIVNKKFAYDRKAIAAQRRRDRELLKSFFQGFFK